MGLPSAITVSEMSLLALPSFGVIISPFDVWLPLLSFPWV